MKSSIDSYTNFPGEHCGSVAMRGLLNHYCGLNLPEPAIFGLASGIDCVYLQGEEMDPSRLIFGRSIQLETDLARNLQVDYREQTDPDDDHAWDAVREEILCGRPTMLSGDIFYLDYREYTVHFPGHRFVLLGFDDASEKAMIADRIRVEPELCSYGAVRQSRNPPTGMSTQNLWGRFHDQTIGRELIAATRVALEHASRRMLGLEAKESTPGIQAHASSSGLEGLRRLASEITGWGAREDARWVASYNARCIEKFGNGGGNFRRLYAGFLDWAHALDPNLVPDRASATAWKAADGWTSLSQTLHDLSRENSNPQGWQLAGEQAREILGHETQLFESIHP